MQRYSKSSQFYLWSPESHVTMPQWALPSILRPSIWVRKSYPQKNNNNLLTGKRDASPRTDVQRMSEQTVKITEITMRKSLLDDVISKYYLKPCVVHEACFKRAPCPGGSELHRDIFWVSQCLNRCIVLEVHLPWKFSKCTVKSISCSLTGSNVNTLLPRYPLSKPSRSRANTAEAKRTF